MTKSREYRVRCSGSNLLVIDELSKQLLRSDLNAFFYMGNVKDFDSMEHDVRLFDFDNDPLPRYLDLASSNAGKPTIIVASERVIPPVALLMIEKYATVVISKNDVEDDIVIAFEHLFQDEDYYSPMANAGIFEGKLQCKINDLRPREAGVLVGYAMDKTTKEIAELLNISKDTVAKYRSNLKVRYDIHSDGKFAEFLDDLKLNRYPFSRFRQQTRY